MPDEADEIRQECALGARFIWQELRDVWGHVASRLPSGDGFALKFVRLEDENDPDEVRAYDYEGRQIAGTKGTPGEITIYTEVFKARPEVNAVVHTHPHVATALTTAGKTVFAITHQSSQLGDGIPVFRGNFIDGVEIGQDLAQELGDGHAILMKGHGLVTVGGSVPTAVGGTLLVEQAAKQQIMASMVGIPEILPKELRDYQWVPGQEAPYDGGPHGGAANLWKHLVWEAKSGRAPGAPPPFPF